MDEEDLREREESRLISTTDGFGGFGTQDDPSIRNALEDLFRPLEDTMGEKLLGRMGWKRGQGIGPRMLRKIDPNDPTSETREFPPEDSPMLHFASKNDTKGLGYGADEALLVRPASNKQLAQDISDDDETHPGLSFAKLPKKSKKTGPTSIGVGSLNDTGSDDEDPYEMGPKMSYNRALGGDKKSKKPKVAGVGSANPSLKTKPVFVSKKLPSVFESLRKCHDGKLPLTGFVLADEIDTFGAMTLSDKKFQPPEVPHDWQPAKLTADSTISSEQTQHNTPNPSSSTTQQTTQSRAQLLGETPLQGKSIFDYLSPAARDRLVTTTGNTTLPPALGETPTTISTLHLNPTDPRAPPSLKIPPLDPTTALTALTRLKKDKNPPYSDDLPKQGRYKDYLRYSSTPNLNPRPPPLRAPHHHKSDTDHLAELHEFLATALLFKPATGLLASRFTSAATEGRDGNPDGAEGVTSTADLLTRPAQQKLADPAEEAARMGMFGIATRSTIGFYPARLVCKRFGVSDVPAGP